MNKYEELTESLKHAFDGVPAAFAAFTPVFRSSMRNYTGVLVIPPRCPACHVDEPNEITDARGKVYQCRSCSHVWYPAATIQKVMSFQIEQVMECSTPAAEVSPEVQQAIDEALVQAARSMETLHFYGPQPVPPQTIAYEPEPSPYKRGVLDRYQDGRAAVGRRKQERRLKK